MLDRRLPDGRKVDDAMFEAACAAAPYIHARLASAAISTTSNNVHYVISDRPMTIDEWTERYASAANDSVSFPPADDDATGTDC
jgi:hypothetical protein